MKKFYLFKKENTYFAFDPFYGELEELTMHPLEYYEHKYYVYRHNNLDDVKAILENYSVSYREQFKIVEFKFEVIETLIT